MSRIDRSVARARKAFAHHAAEAADAKASKRAARTISRAERGERHARASYLESLRLADVLDFEGA